MSNKVYFNEDVQIYTDVRFPGVHFFVQAEPDQIPVRGNALVSGDDASDREAEDEILRRLESNDQWAWAAVTVVARVERDDEAFEGTDSLGACSYADEEDFVQSGGYFDEMKKSAYDDLLATISAAVKRSEVAGALIADLSR